MNKVPCNGCCPNPQCDRGMIYDAVWDEDLNRWEPRDSRCPTCDRSGHASDCDTWDAA